MSDMSLAEQILRAEPTETLKKLRNDMIAAFKNVPNAEAIVDRDYALIRDELIKRGVAL